MIEVFLYYNLLLIILFLIIHPFIFCFLVAGIEGLKDGLDLVTSKDYYLKAVLPTLIIVNVTVIISFLIKLLIFNNFIVLIEL